MNICADGLVAAATWCAESLGAGTYAAPNTPAGIACGPRRVHP